MTDYLDSIRAFWLFYSGPPWCNSSTPFTRASPPLPSTPPPPPWATTWTWWPPWPTTWTWWPPWPTTTTMVAVAALLLLFRAALVLFSVWYFSVLLGPGSTAYRSETGTKSAESVRGLCSGGKFQNGEGLKLATSRSEPSVDTKPVSCKHVTT